MGAVLAEAAASSGLNVAASQSYGSRARGGATRSDVILSAEEIDFPHVHHPDISMILAQEAYDLYEPDVNPGGVILVDDFFVKPREKEGIFQHSLPGTRMAVEEIGNRVAANFLMFGAFTAFSKVVNEREVLLAMENLVNPRFLEVNTKAFKLGIEIGSDLTKWEG
jgi:2-oxoglutarate ferredoxin oxidoreductase subunit gamma